MFLRITYLLALGSISLLAAEDKLEWKALPDLPGDLGVAGPFAGVHNDALIVAGGANFPDGVPWRQLADGSTPAKVYNDTIHVVTRDGLDYTIAEAKAKLPRALGYGVSIPTADGVLCIGGEWREGGEKHRSAKVFALGFADGKIIVDEKYPPLPAATPPATRFPPREPNVVFSQCWDSTPPYRLRPKVPTGFGPRFHVLPSWLPQP